MKVKNSFVNSFVKHFITSPVFIGIICVLFLLSLSFLDVGYDLHNYFNRLIMVFKDILTPLLSIGLISLFTLIYLQRKLREYDYYFIRLANKREYHYICLKCILKCITVVYVCFILLTLVVQLIYNTNVFLIGYYNILNNEIYNLTYLIWIIIKLYLVDMVFISYNYMLFHLVNNMSAIIINVLLISFLYFYNSLNIKYYLIFDTICLRNFTSYYYEILFDCINIGLSYYIYISIFDLLIKKYKAGE